MAVFCDVAASFFSIQKINKHNECIHIVHLQILFDFAGQAIDDLADLDLTRQGVHDIAGIYNKAWCTLRNTRGWNYRRAFEVNTTALLTTDENFTM